MPSLELSGYSIDDVTKGLGATAVGAYVTGYIILSYYLSTFGFNPLSPFRSRVLETGICALILFAIPMSLAMAVASISRRDMQLRFILVIRLLCLPIFCEAICAVPGFVDELPRSIPLNAVSKNRILAATIIGLIPVVATALTWISFLVAKWIWHNYHKRKILVIIILCLISAIFVYLGIGPPNTTMHRHIFLWFLTVSTVLCAVMGSSRETAAQKKIDETITEAEKLDRDLDEAITQLYGGTALLIPKTQIELESRELKNRIAKILEETRSHTSLLRLETVLTVLGSLAILGYSICTMGAYANWVFPFIPLKLGGGEIVSVTLYQTEQNQSWRYIHGGLLDQSDQGFYVLPSGHDKGLFIPKERIEAIYFGDGPPDLGNATK
jgi:hypothetical protein